MLGFLRGWTFSKPFNPIGSIIGRFLVEEHRHQHEQELLVSGVEKKNLETEDFDSAADPHLIG